MEASAPQGTPSLAQRVANFNPADCALLASQTKVLAAGVAACMCAACRQKKTPHGRGIRDRRCCSRSWEAIRCLARGSDGKCDAMHPCCQASAEA